MDVFNVFILLLTVCLSLHVTDTTRVLPEGYCLWLSNDGCQKQCREGGYDDGQCQQDKTCLCLLEDLVFTDPVIDPAKGYHVEKLGNSSAYWLTNGGYHSMFVVYDTGVVVLDAPPAFAGFLPDVIREIACDLPVTHFIYSHHHTDHIGGAPAIVAMNPGNMRIIAHEATAAKLAKRRDPNRPLPTETFGDNGASLDVGKVTIRMDYRGVNHVPGNIFIYMPYEKILMLIDTMFVGWAPFKGFGLAEDIGNMLTTPQTVLDNYDFKYFVSGHLSRLGSRKDVLEYQDYINDILYSSDVARKTYTFYDAITESGYPPMDLHTFDFYFKRMVEICVREMTEKWAARPAYRGLDVFLDRNCDTIITAQNIDIGAISSLAELKN